jgi:hypothetical protein
MGKKGPRIQWSSYSVIGNFFGAIIRSYIDQYLPGKSNKFKKGLIHQGA